VGNGQSMNGADGHGESVSGSASSRDAWALDGFAPLPGDTLALPGAMPARPDGERGVVATVYLCTETSGEDVTRWTWALLEDGRLLEIAPRGCALYEPPVVLERGTMPFLALVAQDGALVRFEERVRAGTWEARPVRLTLERRRWRVTATGTVTAQRLGPVPPSGWGQLGQRAHTAAPPTDDPPAISQRLLLPAGGSAMVGGWGSGVFAQTSQPATVPEVYFTLAGTGDDSGQGIGMWATDVCVAFGRRLGDTPAAAGLSVVSGDQPDAPPLAP
jgi:hypothetical protein